MPDGLSIPGGPSFIGNPQPPDVPCDPSGNGWRGPQGFPGPPGPIGPPGISGDSVINVLDHGAMGDGVTDDTAAIQNALNAYAGKAVVFIPDTGQPYMVNPLLPPTGTDLLLHGTLKLRPGSVTNTGVLFINNANNVTIRGHGALDGNGPAQTGTLGASLMSYQAGNLRVSGITITNAQDWPLDIRRSSNVVVSGCTLSKGTAANQFTEVSDDCWLMNCTIDGTGNGDYGFAFYGGVTNSGAIGNVVKNAGVGTASSAPGIGVLSDGTDGGPNGYLCRDIVIANNICHDNGGPGIAVLDVATPVSAHSGVVVSNNRCYNNCKIGSPPGNIADIYLDHSTGVTMTGNNISANGNSGGQVAGIFLGPGLSHVGVFGNQISNIGQGRTDGLGIENAAANYVFVSGNHIYDAQATPTMSSSIAGNAGTHNTYVDNSSDLPTALALNPDTVVVGRTSDETAWGVTALGIRYNAGSAIAFGWTGSSLGFSVDGNSEGNLVGNLNAHAVTISWGGSALACAVDGSPEGNILTDVYMATRPNAANDAAAAAAGVPVSGAYRNGSVLQVRVT